MIGLGLVMLALDEGSRQLGVQIHFKTAEFSLAKEKFPDRK